MANAQHLIYRPDVLEQAGVEPPTSYEEVLEAAEAIKAAGLMDTPFAANVKPGWDLGEGCCQTNANSSQLGQVRSSSASTELPPLGESGGAGLLVNWAA
jgi:hypothetical protein